MSSDEEMNFLSAGDKSLRTFLRYKWKTMEDNPELSGIVTREYNTIQPNNNYSSNTTTSMSTPNVMAPPYIPNNYNNNHVLTNRRSGNLSLTNPNLGNPNKNINDYGRTQANTGISSVYYSMSNQDNTLNNTPANPGMGGMMNMGMNMNMGMGMNSAVGINNTTNPKMAYSSKYANNWQANTRVSNGRGRGRGGLSHRASNRSLHGIRSYQNSNPTYNSLNMETPDISSTSATSSTIPSSTAASKGMDATVKEFVMPKKNNHRISIDNFYSYDHDTSSDSTSYLKDDEGAKNLDKDNIEDHHGEEDTIIEKQSQDDSIKEVVDNTNDATEIVEVNDTEPSTTVSISNNDLTAEVILSSLDTETKWGDMKDSSALPPLNIPFTSSNLTTEAQENVTSDDEQETTLEFVSKPITRTKLNISRIPPGMTYDQLKSLFLEYGQIINMTIKPAKIGTVAFLEYTTPAEAIQAVRALDDAYAVDEATPINQIPQTLDSLCVDFAYSDGITRHHRQGVTPIFIKGLPSDMKRGDLKIICIEFGDLAKTRLSKIDNGHGIKCSATIEYVRKDSTRLALAYLGDLFHKYGYNTVKVEKYNTNRNSYKPHP